MDKNARTRMRFWRFPIYTCINCPKKLFMSIIAKIIRRLVKTKTKTLEINRAGMGILKADITLGLTNGGASRYILDKLKLLERKDFFRAICSKFFANVLGNNSLHVNLSRKKGY